MMPTHSTTPPVPAAASAEEALRFAEALAHACAEALGQTVAGVILPGSLTLGDYLPGRSDVDLRVVTRVELSMCRAHGRSVVGAAPAELIGEVPAGWVVAVGDTQLADWQAIGDDPKHAELTVLTTCRIWRPGKRD